MSDMFLTKDEVAILTGRSFKRLQIEQLRKMGIPFWVNAVGVPIIARVAIEGGKKIPAAKPEEVWIPNVLREK